jgi:hypothetical protein
LERPGFVYGDGLVVDISPDLSRQVHEKAKELVIYIIWHGDACINKTPVPQLFIKNSIVCGILLGLAGLSCRRNVMIRSWAYI